MSKHVPMIDHQGRHVTHPDRQAERSGLPGLAVHHTAPPARGMEAIAHGTKPACLDKPPVAKGYNIAASGSMHHVAEDGERWTGVSRTESQSVLQGDWLPTTPPVVGKRLAPAPVAWGNKSVGAEPHDASGRSTEKILREGYAASGSDHPANIDKLAQSVKEQT